MKTDEQKPFPADLVQSFATCENFPDTTAGVIALAQSLKRASDDFHVTMQEIVQACCDASRYCPTPRDIRNVALSLHEERQRKIDGSRYAHWEQIYGPAQLEWSENFLGLLSTAGHDERKRAIHIRAIRDMLFYTEGEGIRAGDRRFWEESRITDERDYPRLIEQVRAAGGWQNERELQTDWIDVAWQSVKDEAQA